MEDVTFHLLLGGNHINLLVNAQLELPFLLVLLVV